jgi:hypothetical protein
MNDVSSVLNFATACVAFVTALLTIVIARDARKAEKRLPANKTSQEIPLPPSESWRQFKGSFGHGFRVGIIFMCLVNILVCLAAPFIATGWQHHPDFKPYNLFGYALTGVMGGNAFLALGMAIRLWQLRHTRAS